MTAKLSSKTTQRKKQRAFILLPVILTLTILAAVAYLLSREGAINAGNVIREHQQDTALYVAQAGYNHAVWQLNRKNCSGYTDIPDTTLGDHSYLATYTDTTGTTLTAGSPVNINVVGTLASGASYTIKRNREKLYYPLTTVTLQLGADPGKDVLIDSFYSSRNHGDYQLGVSSEPVWLRYQLIQFDLSSFPTDAIIVSAQLELKQTSTVSAGVDAQVSVHRVRQSWVEGSKAASGIPDGATWETNDGSLVWDDGSGGSYDATATSSSSITAANVSRYWDITTLVQDWHNGVFTNDGILLKGSGTVNVTFASKENSIAANRPKLIIGYNCECGKSCGVVGPPPPAKKVYWTNDVAEIIQRSDEDGSNVETVISNQFKVRGLDIDTVNGKIYWTSDDLIKRANLNGSNIETIFTTSTEINFDVKLDVTAGKMYWTYDNLDVEVMRANLDGSSVETLNILTNRPMYFSLDPANGFIYLTEYGNNSISRMNLDGSGATTIVAGGGTGAMGSAIDTVNGKIYWTGGISNDWIKRANLDGSSEETIIIGQNSPQDISYDADNDRIYWTDAIDYVIRRANADGTNIETIVSAGNRPRGIILVDAALVVPPPSAGVIFEEFTEAELGSNGTSLTINKPVGTAAGDLLIAAVATDGNNSSSLGPPAGWNVVHLTDSSGKSTFGVWWKIASASESSSYTFSWSSNEHAYGWVMRFTGHDPASPIDVYSNSVGSSSAPTSSSVVTTVADTMILRLGGFDDDDVTAGAPGLSGHTPINMGRSGIGNASASGGSGYVLQSIAGDSGVSSFTLTNSEQYVTVTIAIAPAP